MSLKFKDTLGSKVSDKAREINDGVLTAYDVKRKEIDEKNIPKFAKDVLTPEEIKRAGNIGLIIGVIILLIGLLMLARWVSGI